MNIIRYVKRMKDKTFEEVPFNNVDALIFAELGYVSFDVITKTNDFVKFCDMPVEKAKKVYDKSFDAVNNKKLLDLMRTTTRFGDVKVGNCHSLEDYNTKTQFYAVTFILPNGDGIISYRGTDITINGWKEDLLVAYEEYMPGAIDATNYLNKAVKLFDGKFYVLGHSKGGNLATYAALSLNKTLAKRLIKAYSFDGPGSKIELNAFKNWELILPKIDKYITSNDMIGVIYNKIKTAKIIYSTGVLLGGHDLFTWQIDIKGPDFKYMKDRSFVSKSHEEALMNWLVSMPTNEKQFAVEVLSEFFGDSKTIYDLILKATKNLTNGKQNWNSYSLEEKEKAKEIFTKLAKYYLEAYSPKAIMARKKQAKLDLIEE